MNYSILVSCYGNMKKVMFLSLLLFCSTIVFGQNKKIQPENEILFKIKNSGISVEGKFKGLAGVIIFDTKNIATSLIDVSIDAKTINTDNNTRDGHLKKKEYFDVESFPKILFQSKKIELTKSGYLATGNLTMKGKTKEIKIPFIYSEKGNEGVFNGSFNLNRLDYGVGSSSWILSDNATITLTIKVLNQ